jgi:hypothetical protein
LEMNRIEAMIHDLEGRIGRWGAAIVITIFIALVACVLAYPATIWTAWRGDMANSSIYFRFVNSYLPISADPLNVRITDPDWQMTRQRVLGPLIAYALHMRGRSSVLISPLSNLFIYFFTYTWLRKRTQAATAFATALVLSLTLSCVSSQELPAFQDSLANLFLLLALFLSSPPISAASIFVGMLADERIFAAAGLVLLWHWILNPQGGKRDFWIRCAWLAGAAMMYAVFFLILKHHVGIDVVAARKEAFADFRTFRLNIWLGWYFGLRGAWILVVALGLFWLDTGRKILVIGLLAALMPVMGSSLTVQDISRVSSIAFVAFLVAVVGLFRQRPILANHLLIAAMIVQIFTPIWTVVALQHRTFQPLPLILLDELVPKLPSGSHPATMPG